MSVKELSNYVFTSKYANHLSSKNRRELWIESVDRVKQMMLEKYSNKNIEQEIEWAYSFVEKKRIIGSQRAMQFGGKPILKKNARMFNCISSYCDRIDFFKEAFWLLLCGCGVGFSVQKQHIESLPKLKSIEQFNQESNKEKYIIPDSIEGWADSIDLLIRSFIDKNQVEFDYSLIRKKGELLSHGMGKAPGPEILEKCHQKIKDLLLKQIENKIEVIKSIIAYDVVYQVL